MDTKKKGERTRPACGFRRLAEPKRGGFSLSSPKRRRGPGRGGRFSSLSPALSPLVPRGERGKKALSVFMPNTILVSRHVDRTREPFPVRNIDSPRRNADCKESTFRRPDRPSGTQYGASGKSYCRFRRAGCPALRQAGGLAATTQTLCDSPHMTRAPGDPALWPSALPVRRRRP